MPAAAPDFQVTRTYLELVLELPWKKVSREQDRPARRPRSARRRPLRSGEDQGADPRAPRGAEAESRRRRPPILCLVGPPGVGKTSLGQSVARATGRSFERVSLGGMHDESELRGHRRTYIGAMPGRLIQALRRAGVNNPVLMLDEIDKLGRDYPRRPGGGAARDPRPGPEPHVPRQLPRPGVRPVERLVHRHGERTRHDPATASGSARSLAPVRLLGTREGGDRPPVPDPATGERDRVCRTDRSTCRTRRFGARQLGTRARPACGNWSRRSAALARKVAVRFAEGKTDPVTVRPEDLTELLGPERFSPEEARKTMPPGCRHRPGLDRSRRGRAVHRGER